ncbi:DUF2249 domain-containing protein [Motiliproteus sp. SC1-56]|uniref:DUF2249 domain-containing protein n=1 Tax=Motiliproteus sp. SC1-56 TaxID=2799565 RepID=UPI001A8DFDAE|nr:DUF2249 domain-containing protein [Motiliproteus sp. SC1-56]
MRVIDINLWRLCHCAGPPTECKVIIMRDNDCRIPGATLDFRRYSRDGKRYLEFDSTGCHCPVPMVNAMAGLQQSLGEGARLVMVNGFEPEGLYERIRGCFDWQVERLKDERVRITFTAIEGQAERLDFSNRGCKGG